MGLHLGSVVLLIFKCSHVCKTEMAMGNMPLGNTAVWEFLLCCDEVIYSPIDLELKLLKGCVYIFCQYLRGSFA